VDVVMVAHPVNRSLTSDCVDTLDTLRLSSEGEPVHLRTMMLHLRGPSDVGLPLPDKVEPG